MSKVGESLWRKAIGPQMAASCKGKFIIAIKLSYNFGQLFVHQENKELFKNQRFSSMNIRICPDINWRLLYNCWSIFVSINHKELNIVAWWSTKQK